MDEIPALTDVTSPEDLKKFRAKYEKELEHGKASVETQFAYSWCLVRSKNKSDLHHGVALLEELYHKAKDETSKRDYLYFLAIGHTKLKDLNKALKFGEAILIVEPGNHQAKQLCDYINKQIKKDGYIGMAIVGGAAALAVGGIVSLGVALSRK